MTTALDRTRALLDTPAPDPIPGQLDLEHPMPDLTCDCPPRTHSAFCATVDLTPKPPRRSDVHQARTRAFAAQQTTTTRSNR